MSPEFVLEITKEDYDKSGSKFITVPADVKEGAVFYRKIETGMLDWDTPGKSMKLPTTVIEETDKGHEEKISFGIDAKGIWKGKAIYKAITGKEMEFKKGSDGKMHPVINSEAMNGKFAVGVWVVNRGKNPDKADAKELLYPKLQDIYPANYQPTATKELGL